VPAVLLADDLQNPNRFAVYLAFQSLTVGDQDVDRPLERRGLGVAENRADEIDIWIFSVISARQRSSWKW
jgi:hypothetical protein